MEAFSLGRLRGFIDGSVTVLDLGVADVGRQVLCLCIPVDRAIGGWVNMVWRLVWCLANLVGGGEFREFPKNVSKDKLGALGGFSQSGLVLAACSLLLFEMV